ncbi:MAG TPA: NAD(P)/FAD-dependent oxidoreductase [Thermoanaerobaculia bacterium]|jgi:phytoene dehydrogenase-like protein|nr:NAD(P)/FAD-dependent oxidoreductase [Thermoanaerobaculia bacterium]
MKRLFRGLRRAPDPRYDAVVIGSGIGGLIAANLLARDGARVLLVEQHYMVGGYCSTFRRGGFTFDAATHFYPLLGNPETLTGRLLAELGVETGWVKMDPVDTFHLPDGSRFTVPADFAAYLAKLHAEFPHERAALDAFFAEVREAYLLGLLEHFRGRETARLAPYRDLTVRQALDRRFADRKLKLLLTADCPHWGSPPGRTSFVFDSMLRLSYFLGNYYPKGGSQAFADELARCFEERGGHVLMSTAARRIVVEDGGTAWGAGGKGGAGTSGAAGANPGVARGVVLETLRGPVRFQGTVACGAVVSNADLLGTLEHLVGAEHLPPGTLPRLRGLRPTFPCWLTHIGLAGVPAEALEQAQGYYWDSWDMDRVGRDALRFKLFVPTLYEPAIAPPGGQVLIVQKVQELDYEAVTDWPEHKRQVESFVLGHLSRLIPGIEDKIVVRASASAETSWRFTLNHHGAMLGWEMSPDQLGAGRPDLASPVRNLFFAGHWVRPGGGITPVIVSAQHAAQAVAGALSRREWPPPAAASWDPAEKIDVEAPDAKVARARGGLIA